MLEDSTVMKSKKELRKEQVQHFFLAMVAVVVIVIVSWAWFASNDKVSGTGMSISGQGIRFEIASMGEQTAYYDKSFNNNTVGNKTIIDGNTYYSTGSGSISWMISDTSNINNESVETMLYPGMYGKINFSVLPKVDDLNDLNFTLELEAYGEVTKDTEGAIKITTEDNEAKYYAPLNKNSKSYKLLQGHLLFFTKYSDSNRYSDRILCDGNSSYSDGEGGLFEKNSTSKDTHRDYSIYWIWPGYFEQYVEPYSFLYPNGLFKSSNQAMINDLNSNKDCYFADNAGNNVEIIPEIKSSMTSANLQICSNFYNSADETIGRNVAFIKLTLFASEG